MYGYCFPRSTIGYDAYSFNPAFSDGIVTQQDIDGLMQDLNSIPNIQQDSSCDPICCIIPVVFVVGGIILVAVGVSGSTAINFVGPIVGVLIFGSLITVICILAKRQIEKLNAFYKAIHEVIKKHQEGVFSSKNCTIRLMPYHTYIAIDFAWRPRPVVTPE